MSPNQASLVVSQLRSIRGDRELFRDVGFTLEGGEVLQIHGANGSGKTTILRILAGLTRPDAGEIRWQGQLVSEDWQPYLAELRYIGHLSGIKLELSPMENLRFAPGLLASAQAMPLEQALDEVALYGFEDEPARTLSAGQRRRIALARLLVSPGRLWLLDEPHTSLDKAGMEMLRGLMHRHLESGGLIILASHNPLELKEQHIRSLQLVT